MKPLGKLAGVAEAATGLTGLTCDSAGVVIIPRPESPASLLKCRRENLPSIDVSRDLRSVRHRTLQHPGGLVRIDLIGGNPVDLEFDHDRRFPIDDADPDRDLRADFEIAVLLRKPALTREDA